MVEPSFNAITDKMDTITPKPTGLNSNLQTGSSLNQTIKAFKEIQNDILDNIKGPQFDGMEQRDAVETLLRKLQKAVEEENSGKTREILELKDELASSE